MRRYHFPDAGNMVREQKTEPINRPPFWVADVSFWFYLIIKNIIMNISQENITKLEGNQIFVFGSNLSGRHGKGAAKTALSWGAKWGQAKGLQGRTYGIPTKDASIRRTLTIDEIKVFVNEFISFAKTNQNYNFLVTEIGCGLAGLKPKQIAPLFSECKNLSNVYLPIRFWHFLN